MRGLVRYSATCLDAFDRVEPATLSLPKPTARRRPHGDDHEAYLSAKPPRAQTPPRFSQAHADTGWPARSGPPPRQGPQAALGLTPDRPPPKSELPPAEPVSAGRDLPHARRRGIQTLKLRAEFQRIRGGSRAQSAAFVLEGKPRVAAPAGAQKDAQPAITGPRFGFTITKKLGNAVVRNRMRRRLRAALSDIVPLHARADMDYVVVARQKAFDQEFASLKADLTEALKRVNTAASRPHRVATIGNAESGTPGTTNPLHPPRSKS